MSDASTVHDRLKSVREATPGAPTQGAFAVILQRRAEQLFGDEVEHRYAQTLVNRLENGGQSPTLQDIAVYAALDPLRRGREWLGWGESRPTVVRRVAETAASPLARTARESERPGIQRPKAKAPAKKASAKKKNTG